MKIIKLSGIPDKDGYFPIPKNLLNREMFCYPCSMLGKEDKWGTKEREKKKVNAIVSYWGEFFGDKLWNIGMMGYDNMLIFDETGVEHDCYWRLFIYSGGTFIYKLKNDDDWHTYDKNKLILERNEKIDKILNHE